MSLDDFGVQSWPALRSISRDDAGEVCCPVAGHPIAHTRGEIELPVVHVADDELRDALEAAGVETLRGQGYESPHHDLLVPETVGGPSASGYSSRMVGVRVELSGGGHVWTPVHRDDLEAADDALDMAHAPHAAADGSGAVDAGNQSADSPDAESEPAGAVSADERPDVVAELGLPTEYDDGRPRYTYVGHCQRDDVDVYAGRSGSDGERDFITTEEIGTGGWLGNPYPADVFGREECVDMFMRAFLTELERNHELRTALAEQVRGKVLGCWCHSLEETGEDHPVCHADVIARIADSLRPAQGGDSA